MLSFACKLVSHLQSASFGCIYIDRKTTSRSVEYHRTCTLRGVYFTSVDKEMKERLSRNQNPLIVFETSHPRSFERSFPQEPHLATWGDKVDLQLLELPVRKVKTARRIPSTAGPLSHQWLNRLLIVCASLHSVLTLIHEMRSDRRFEIESNIFFFLHLW